MPAQRSQPTTTGSALFALAAALGLAACGSDAPETIQYPTSASAPARPADAGASPPVPPQPSSQPSERSDSSALPTYDGTLAAMVESAIKAEPELNTLGIDVSAVDGVIYLRGEARTREARRLATEVASKVDGVKAVENELFVMAGSQPEQRRDGRVAAVR